MIYLLPHIIERSAERYPDHEAMRFNNGALTYASLVQRANRLAQALAAQGVRRGDRVGIYLNKSLESAVAIYGIMQAGAVYVPLDPYSPPSRLAFVIRHCAIRHLVTHPPKLEGLRALLALRPGIECVIGVQLPEEEPTTGLTPDRPRSISWEQIDSSLDGPPPKVHLMEQDLAYIMYTSGSTGQPKGMMHTHASGLSYARMAAHTYDLTHADRLSNHSPLHFDMSTFDYFSGPLAGATTVIIPEAYTKLPASLSKLIETEKLTVWYSVPFALIQLLLRGALPGRDLSSLRWILFGGEPFPPGHLYDLMRLLPQARFSNVYGPAEVNQCTYYHLPPPAEDAVEPIPLGKIWDNAEGLVVDAEDHPVEPGEAGELLVRTPTMMRGYWGRPDLNERAFYRRKRFENLEDVFYRTGDLVQLQPDGNLKFLGRKDRQIKTRGYRVELDEVENALGTHPQVEENAVYALPDEDGSLYLEAAVIARSAASPNGADLKDFLSGLLPEYAVPRRILLLEEFPRTGSGKIDRGALVDRALQARTVAVA